MTHWEQDLVRIWVEREVNIKLSVVLLDVVVECDGFVLRERMNSSVSITAWSSACALISCLIRDQPVECKVTIWINAVADRRHWGSCLTPVSVEVAGIFITIRIWHWNDVPIDILSDVLNFRVGWTKQLVENEGWSSWCNPLASVNVCFNKNCSIVLQ